MNIQDLDRWKFSETCTFIVQKGKDSNDWEIMKNEKTFSLHHKKSIFLELYRKKYNEKNLNYPTRCDSI